MPQTFNCPNCSAPMEYDGSGYPTMRCPFCNNSVVVPQELRVRRDSPAAPASTSAPQPMPGPSFMPPISVGSLDLGGLIAQAGKFKQIKELVETGQKVEAVRLYRELLGVDEAVATQAVEALASGQPIVMTSNMTTFETPAVMMTTSTTPMGGVGGVGSLPGTYTAPVGTRAGRRAGVALGIAGCVFAVIVVGIVGIVAAAVFGFLALFKSHPVYQMAVTLAKNDPAVVKLLGEPITEGWFATGSIEENTNSGQAAMAGALSGPKGSADISIDGFKNADGSWELNSVTIVSKDSNVVLTYSPDTRRFESSP